MDDFRQVDRRAWKKYLFYVDMVVWGIFALSVSYVVGNIYLVGFYEGAAQSMSHEASWWKAFIGLSFMTAALAWVFFRFWKNGFLAIRRPF